MDSGYLSLALIGLVSLPLSVYAQQAQGSCTPFQTAASRASALVAADTSGIRQLEAGFKINASALDDWATMTADQKSKLYQTAVLNLIQAAAAAPFINVTAGSVSLPNGIASIGTGQVGALINQLRSNGIENAALFNLIRSAATVSGKPEAAKLGSDILGALINLFQTGSAAHDATSATSGPDLSAAAVETAASVAQLGLGLMDSAYAGYAAALGAGADTLTLAQSAFIASTAANQIRQLTDANGADLSELQRRVAKLQNDVQASQKAKAQFATCQKAPAPPPSTTEQCAESAKACFRGCSLPKLSSSGVTPKSDFDAVAAYGRCMDSCGKGSDTCMANLRR